MFDESNFTLQVQWDKVQITHAQHSKMLLVHTTDLQVLHFQSLTKSPVRFPSAVSSSTAV